MPGLRRRLILSAAAVVVLLAVGTCLVEAAPDALGSLETEAKHLNMFLPIAEVWVNLPVLLALGFVVGVFSGMTGVGGAFLMTPLLMAMGVPASVAVGTGSTQVAGTAASGTLVHWRMGNVDARLGLVALVGSVVGGTLGVHLVAMLEAAGSFDFWVKVIYVLLSGTVGTLTLRESLGELLRRGKAGAEPKACGESDPRACASPGAGSMIGRITAKWPLQAEFGRAKIKTSILVPFALGLFVGILAAVIGVGGGFILVPAMIYILGVPTHVAVGTSLFQLVFTASNVGFQQAVTNHNVDVMLAVLLMIGAAVGSQVGGLLGRRLDGCQLRVALGMVVWLVMVRMLVDVGLSLFGPESAKLVPTVAPAVHETGVLRALGSLAVEDAPAYGALSVVIVVAVGLALTALLSWLNPLAAVPIVKRLAGPLGGWLWPKGRVVSRQSLDGATKPSAVE
jgi:uncharacterized membrane protein YfcA